MPPSESVEWFIEDQAFSPSYYLPPPPHPPPVSKLDRRQTGRLRKRDNLLIGEGGRGAKSARKPGALKIIQYSLVSPDGVGGEYEKTSSAAELSVYDTGVCVCYLGGWGRWLGGGYRTVLCLCDNGASSSVYALIVSLYCISSHVNQLCNAGLSWYF